MKTASYKNIKIAYSDVGKGRAVVLLHGFLENKKMWNPYVPEFSKKYRVITIDLLGHGDSDCLGYVHEMEEQAAAVHKVLSKLRIRKALVVGHSMGGYVALALAELYPNLLKGLVLLNSTAKADSEEKKANRERAIKAVKKEYASFVRLSIANLFSEENRGKLIDEIENVKQEALKTPLRGIIAALEGMKIRKDRQGQMRLFKFPITLILGRKDPVLSFNESISQIENTNAKLIALPDGHMSHIENRQEVANILLAFFKAPLIFSRAPFP